MIHNAVTALLLAGIVSTLPTDLERRQWPGKCTVGIEFGATFVPRPISGGSPQVVDSAYSYILGSDGVQTNENVIQINDNEVQGRGDYAGREDWYITSGGMDKYAVVDYCVATLGGVTWDSRNAPAGTCDIYSGSGPFYMKGGCRCRFDCY